MYINTEVVRALMALRRIDDATLANIANVATPLLSKWLYDPADGSEELIAFDTQLEILRVLGINGETPRNDIVHYWYIHEPLMSRSSQNYWALAVIADAFGKADAVYFARDTDPLATTHSKAHFGLQFQSFKAVLEVTSHPWRNVGFDPTHIKNVQWAPGNFGVLVDEDQFVKLAPGMITPTTFESQLNVGREVLAWERLNLIAKDNNIGALQIEQLLLTVQQGLKTPKLAAEVAEPVLHEPLVAEPLVAARTPVPAAAAPVMAPTQAPPRPRPAPVEPAPVVEAARQATTRPAPKPATPAASPVYAPAAAPVPAEPVADNSVSVAHGLLRSSDNGKVSGTRRQGPRVRSSAGGRSQWGSPGMGPQD